MQKLLLILPFLILFSCSVQKRKYQKGFYVSNTKHAKQVQKNDKIKKDLATETLVLKQTAIPVPEKEESISASVDTKPVLLLSSTFIEELKAGDSLCDLITLKNGEEVSAKILEITPTEVKYQKCGVTDGPLYIVKKTDVFMIKYANGTKEVFKVDSTEPIKANEPGSKKDKYNGPKKMHPLAILAFVSAILGIWPLSGLASIGAVIFANIALKDIKEKPNQYKGETLARVAKVIGIIMLVLTAIILIAVIAVIAGLI
jgi:hypothetical protein